MKSGYTYTVVFMFVISAVFTALLAVANAFYLPAIRENEELAEKKSVLSALGMKTSGEAVEVAKIFDGSVEKKNMSGIELYVKFDESKKISGYAIPFSGSGLWGTINGYAAVSSDLKTILGIDFTSHSETPGLGGRIDEDWFKEQFRGIPLEKGKPIEYKTGDKGQVDAITGATSTSRAVLQIVNQLVESKLSKLEVAQ